MTFRCIGRTVLATAAVVATAVALAGCGGSSNSSNSTTTTAAAQTINGCAIRPNTSCVGVNLAGANLASANLTGATLTGANLTSANLSSANLSNANLSGANLTTANLQNATLVNTTLTGANLTQANFKGANIQNINDAGATQCETVRNDGTVNNSSCPPPAPPTTSVTTVPVTLTCFNQPAQFLAIYQSQADNFNVPPSVSDAATADGNPACASDGWATLKIKTSQGEITAVYQATASGWQLMSVTGCSGTNVPEKDQTGIC